MPHIHFHLIPRPPDASWSATPSFAQQSWLSFGRGQRSELDDDDAATLVARIRAEVRKEVDAVRRVEGVDLEALWSVGRGVAKEGTGNQVSRTESGIKARGHL